MISVGRVIAAAAAILSVSSAVRLSAQETTAGRDVYLKWCAGCHGETGAGDGPGAAAMLPRPRDFTGAIYQIRSTATGGLPTDADLMKVIDEGVHGTAMPGWRDRLSDRERRDVAAYVKTFSAFFADTTQRPVPHEFSRAPGGGDEGLRVGRQFFDSIGCVKCHGDAGRGDGPSAPTLEDDAGHPIYAADLSQNWRFNGGGTVEDIYHRLRTGLDGTPMPSFSDLIDQQFLNDEQLWRVAQYVRSLSPEAAPALRDVVHAPAITGPLPADPDDSTWTRVDTYWFPLVGQIIRTPRWFTPAVAGVWVQAVHTADSLALRLVWDDRSRSPDPEWVEFAEKVLTAAQDDDSTRAPAEAWPDQIAVQFPRHLTDGMERPYFLMGAANDPVYQWRWTSSAEGGTAVSGVARGIQQFAPQAPGLGARAVHDKGQWRLVLTRSLATADTVNQLQFAAGRPIPLAFFAWDGSSGERGSRMGVSTWYFLALDTPTPASTYVSPLVAMALTLGLGLVVVRRAQRRNSSGGTGRTA